MRGLATALLIVAWLLALNSIVFVTILFARWAELEPVQRVIPILGSVCIVLMLLILYGHWRYGSA